eukprot:TRINITY_DN8801_c0_g1_i1.p1 TRINITY_DN8801_c0_g1~~TRINITY_DN8801_c0_g1_i1.p1  ORF type:complete len:228 (-),score=87.27 TRINITY_DN8801_c0_g1_i1:231-887(-)
MSKIPLETLRKGVKQVITYSTEEKKRNFIETIELQIGLKNLDPRKDKRFNGSVKLPHVCKPRMKFCILADQVHVDETADLEIQAKTVEELKKLKKNKKLIKKLAKQYDAFLASETMMRQIPRLGLASGLIKAGKFPTSVTHADSIPDKMTQVRSTVKFQLRKVLCLAVAVGHLELTEDQLMQNIQLAINFLVSLLKKNWQNVRSLHIKSTMGKPVRIY